MTDDRRAGSRPTSSTRDGDARRPDVDDEHRRVPVERGRGRAARDHRPARADRARPTRTSRRSSAWSATRERPVLQLVRPPHRREADDWPPTGAPHTPILSSVDNAWLAVGLQIVRERVPARGARARAVRLDELRRLLPAGRQPHPVPLRAEHRRRRRAATTRSSPRAGSRTTSASRRATSRRRSTTGPWRTFPDSCDWSLAGDAAGRASPQSTRTSPSTRARTRTATRGSCRAGPAACSRR